MVRGVVELRVNFDFSVRLHEIEALQVTLAQLDDFGVGRDESAEVDGKICANMLLLKGGQKEKDEIVLGVEAEVVEEGQMLVLDNGEVEGAAVDVDMGIDGAMGGVFVQHSVQENAGTMDGLHVVPQFAELLLLSCGDCIYVHRLEAGDGFVP